MKKLRLLAIITLALGIVAFNSCKKDDELTKVNETKTETSTFNPRGIENMDEYLLGFMKKIKSNTRDGESMSLSDAEWHLSACLNFQFCNLNVLKKQIVYDTITTIMNVNDGLVSLNDINVSLEEISAEVRAVYNASNVENKNLLFIKPEILDDATRGGVVVRTTVAISDRNDGSPYYFDEFGEWYELDTLFPDYALYQWNTDAIDVLECYMNLFMPSAYENDGRIYADVLRTEYFDHTDYPYIFNGGNPLQMLNKEQMLFYLDYYLYIVDINKFGMSYISSDIVPSVMEIYDKEQVRYYNHALSISYGMLYYTNNPGEIQ